jgi:hypothetical protein
MRYLLFLLGLISFAAAVTPRAEAQSYPWCAVYNMGDAAYNCGFVTREQCMATVSGIGGMCEQNLQYQPPATLASPSRTPYKHYSH